MPTVERITLPAPLPRPFRVAFAADFHIRKGTPLSYVRKLCALLKGLEPDILLLGGDYGEDAGAARTLLSELSRCRFPKGILGVLGNNDRECFPSPAALQRAARFPILVNKSVRVRMDGGMIEIGGVDDLKHGWPDARGLFSRNADYRILLSHFPVVPDFGRGAPADLILSGHTHGGQINLFGLTPYALGYEREMAFGPSGRKESGGTTLFVSTGIGMSKFPIRLGARPRVHLFEFKKPE